MNKKRFKATDYNAPFIDKRADPFVCRGPDGMYYFTDGKHIRHEMATHAGAFHTRD